MVLGTFTGSLQTLSQFIASPFGFPDMANRGMDVYDDLADQKVAKREAAREAAAEATKAADKRLNQVSKPLQKASALGKGAGFGTFSSLLGLYSSPMNAQRAPCQICICNGK